MSKLIHVGTKIEIRFAVLDDEGDVVQVIPLPLELPKFNENALLAVLDKYTETKTSLESQLESSLKPVSNPPTDTTVE